ncbi:7073_t:CDS:1 [Funneliformis geosporum]|uniref:7073_t:CDS:1 n=1 Tax=Funneliformis geosporum TaxID=1117311 RepID=A0A9W4WQK3_9GLOM|nr:7073_t:CDS:1 [Funneliformis geosporum]
MLSMVNAIPHQLLKRAPFVPCPTPKGSTHPVSFLQVSISPDPPVAGQSDIVVVSGTFSEDVTPKTNLAVVFTDLSQQPIAPPTVVSACTKTGCPKAGTKYNQTVTVKAPESLPATYIMAIGVGNSLTDVLGCAYAIL